MSIRTELKRFIKGFSYAGAGVGHCAATQRNFRFHMGAGAAVVWCGLICHVTREQWAALILSIGGVMALECVNTALEHLTDLCVGDKHTALAKHAKDCGAGAVLLLSAGAAAVGAMILLNKSSLRKILSYFLDSPLHLCLGTGFAVLWFVWTFVCFSGKSESRKNTESNEKE